MRDRLERRAGLVVDEREATQRGAVEPAVGADHAGTEALDELLERRLPGFDDGPGHDVGVDDGRPPLGEQLGHGRLAGADPTGEADQQHDHGS